MKILATVICNNFIFRLNDNDIHLVSQGFKLKVCPLFKSMFFFFRPEVFTSLAFSNILDQYDEWIVLMEFCGVFPVSISIKQ